MQVPPHLLAQPILWTGYVGQTTAAQHQSSSLSWALSPQPFSPQPFSSDPLSPRNVGTVVLSPRPTYQQTSYVNTTVFSPPPLFIVSSTPGQWSPPPLLAQHFSSMISPRNARPDGPMQPTAPGPISGSPLPSYIPDNPYSAIPPRHNQNMPYDLPPKTFVQPPHSKNVGFVDSQQYENIGYSVLSPRGTGMTESKPGSSLHEGMLASKQNKPPQSVSVQPMIDDHVRGYGIVPGSNLTQAAATHSQGVDEHIRRGYGIVTGATSQMRSPAASNPIQAEATHLQGVTIKANKPNVQRSAAPTSHGVVDVTLCSARHLPHVDGMWGTCDAFIELVYKDKTLTSTVKKNSLNPEWDPEDQAKFEFDLSSGELEDIRIQIKDWNRTSSNKLLGTTVIGVNALKRLMAGDKAAFPSDEFLITAPDGTPLLGKDQQQAHLVLKVAVVKGPVAEQPGGIMITPDLTGATSPMRSPAVSNPIQAEATHLQGVTIITTKPNVQLSAAPDPAMQTRVAELEAEVHRLQKADNEIAQLRRQLIEKEMEATNVSLHFSDRLKDLQTRFEKLNKEPATNSHGVDSNLSKFTEQHSASTPITGRTMHESSGSIQAEATHLQGITSIANKPNVQRSAAPTSHGVVDVTLCSARHLPHVDGMWGTCDAFIELVYKDKTLTSTVKKNSLNPEWDPEDQAKFEFDLSSGELEDIRIQIKDWNRTSSNKLLGTTVIGVNALKRLMAGDKAAFPSDEFLITAPDGTPLLGKDQQQAHLVLKVAVVKGPVAEQPGGIMIAPDLTGATSPMRSPAVSNPIQAEATHLQGVTIKANKPNVQRSAAPTSHGVVDVTLCSARHLPHVDGMWGTCDAFIELVYKDKTLTSTVKKNSLNPEWDPEDQAKFEFDLSSGELEDIQIQIKDWNRTSSNKLLGTTVIGVNALKRLMAGDKAAFPSDEFLITAPDGTPLLGKDQQQAHLVLKVAVVKGPVAEQPGGMMIAPDLTGATSPMRSPAVSNPIQAEATHLQGVTIKANKPNVQRSAAPTSHGVVDVTLCSARHLPHVDGMWGTCDAFIELVYKDKTLTSTVKKNSLNPEWDPEDQAKFEFDLSSGELEDIRIQIKDWNRTSSNKLLGTTVIGVNALKRLMAGDKAAFPSDEFLITAPDGTPLLGKDQQQAHLVLKVAVVKGPVAEQPGGIMIAPDLTGATSPMRSPAVSNPIQAEATHLQGVTIKANKPNVQRSAAPTSHGVVDVTLCSARHLPHVDGMWGTCDAFIELVYKDKTLTSTVKKNSLNPEWDPEDQAKFEFDLSSGELEDIQIQIKDWNRTSSNKLLGTTVIGVNALKRLMAGDKAAFPSDEFLITAPDGTPLLGKDQQQAHLVLKVAVVKGPVAEQPGGMMIAPDLTGATSPMRSPAVSNPIQAEATHLQGVTIKANKPNVQRSAAPTSHGVVDVTLCSARHLPHVDGMWGTCDAFIELVYKDKTLTSTVKKNSLNPEWDPEDQAKFEFDLSSGELEDIRIQIKDWNRTSSNKLLGTTVIGVNALKRLMAGDKAAFPSDEFLITAPDGTPLLGKDQQQAHLVLKVAVVKGPVAEQPGGMPSSIQIGLKSPVVTLKL